FKSNKFNTKLIKDEDITAKLNSLIRYYRRHKSLSIFLEKNKPFLAKLNLQFDEIFNTFKDEKLTNLISEFKLLFNKV
ncbi:hypothetical protein CN514_19750, partial [Bacillus sp. AFS001701]|uniref:hypothetical protein n=1 Tax=Bacillus sp. AFS001701 TaxID=2033480 RepID=UPI000BFAD3F9